MSKPGKDYFVSAAFMRDFVDFETKEDLFDIRMRGHGLWDYLRYRIFQEFLNFKPDYFKKRQSQNRFKRVLEMVLSVASMAFSFFWPRRTYDLVILNYDRRNTIDGKQVNIHFYPLIKALQDKFRILLVDPSELHTPLKGIYPCDSIRWRPYYLIDRFKNRSDQFTPEESTLLSSLQTKLHDHFGVMLDIEKIAREDFLFPLRQLRRYKNLFERTATKVVLFCDNGNMKAAIEAAHSIGVKAVDYQHSLISEVNVLYTYPDLPHPPTQTLSDVIFTYGEYWNSQYNLPSRRIAVGFPYMEKRKADAIAKMKSIKDRDLNLILISGSYSKDIFIKAAMELADRIPKLTIYYKLRLEDYEGWRDRYPSEFAAKKNIKVIDNNDVSLYEYLALCRYQIGVNSTALVEGMAFDLTTFILKTGWYEEMRNFYENGHAFLTESADEIARLIQQGARPQAPLNPDRLFKNNSMAQLEQTLDSLITQ